MQQGVRAVEQGYDPVADGHAGQQQQQEGQQVGEDHAQYLEYQEEGNE